LKNFLHDPEFFHFVGNNLQQKISVSFDDLLLLNQKIQDLKFVIQRADEEKMQRSEFETHERW